MKLSCHWMLLATALAVSSILSGCSAYKLDTDAAEGDVAAVKSDLAANVPVDANDGDDETALGFAASNGRLSVVQALLAAGAKPDARTKDGSTPLLMAAGGSESGRDYPGVISALIAAGANPNAKDKAGFTALINAAMLGRGQVVPVLVQAGVNVNAPGPLGTPLCSAAWNGNISAMQALIDAGADLNLLGDGTNTPLDCAAVKGRLGAVQLLIKAGADVNGRSEYQTPLWSAALNGDVTVVRALLDAGADVNRKGMSPRSETPLVAARTGHHDGIAALLVQHGGHT